MKVVGSSLDLWPLNFFLKRRSPRVFVGVGVGGGEVRNQDTLVRHPGAALIRLEKNC